MRPVKRGECPKDKNGQPIVFKEYADARGKLIQRIGEYCSYCEMSLDAALAIEHVQPKHIHTHLALSWGNFLLACSNCNSTKGQKDITLSDYFWPDVDNTFRAYTYTRGGVVKVNAALSRQDQVKAQQTIELFGLDKTPNTANASDRRWKNRREAWEEAKDSKKDLAACNTPQMRKQIVRTAVAKGYWSIWMQVFSGDADMLNRFIHAKGYNGTCKSCFDADGSPLPRKNGAL